MLHLSYQKFFRKEEQIISFNLLQKTFMVRKEAITWPDIWKKGKMFSILYLIQAIFQGDARNGRYLNFTYDNFNV